MSRLEHKEAREIDVEFVIIVFVVFGYLYWLINSSAAHSTRRLLSYSVRAMRV